MYDNYLHLVKTITLSEKSQTEEWWHFGDLQEPYTTTPPANRLVGGPVTDSPWEQSRQWAEPRLITNDNLTFAFTYKFHSNQYASAVRDEEKPALQPPALPPTLPETDKQTLSSCSLWCHLSGTEERRAAETKYSWKQPEIINYFPFRKHKPHLRHRFIAVRNSECHKGL